MSNEVLDRIYVASLSDYNAGILHGEWLSFDDFSSAGEVWEAIRAMLADSPTARTEGTPAEEWAIHDFEGFAGIHVPESESIGALWEAYEIMESLDDPEAFADWLTYERSADISEVTQENLSAFQEAYRGWYRSKEEFAEELVEETGLLSNVGELLSRYFDYEAFARDLFMSDYYMTENGYVFSSY